MVPLSIQRKNAGLCNQLYNSRNQMCGIGTRKVKLFLNKKMKEGDRNAMILRTALEAEDANINAKKYFGDYKIRYYEVKHARIQDLLLLYYDSPDLSYGYQEYAGWDTNHIVYFELPGSGEQISFHCNLHYLNNIPVYGKQWDGQVNSTLPKIEDDIMRLYGKEIRQRYLN